MGFYMANNKEQQQAVYQTIEYNLKAFMQGTVA